MYIGLFLNEFISIFKNSVLTSNILNIEKYNPHK